MSLEGNSAQWEWQLGDTQVAGKQHRQALRIEVRWGGWRYRGEEWPGRDCFRGLTVGEGRGIGELLRCRTGGQD